MTEPDPGKTNDAAPIPLPPEELLEREFLPLRAKILEIAATLDRMNRSGASQLTDPRLKKIQAGLELLADNQEEKAELIQLLFSREYDPDWLAQFTPTRRG